MKEEEKKSIQEILGSLSRDQLRFVAEYPNHPSKKSCAEYLRIHVKTVYNWGDVIDDAIEAIERDATESALIIRKNSLVRAMQIKVAGLDVKDAAQRQKVATEIIEWEIGKAQQKIDHTSKGERITADKETINESISALAEALGNIMKDE